MLSNYESVRKSLLESLGKNVQALDFVENSISKEESNLKFNERDEIARFNLEQLYYIKICLEFLGKSYKESLSYYK